MLRGHLLLLGFWYLGDPLSEAQSGVVNKLRSELTWERKSRPPEGEIPGIQRGPGPHPEESGGSSARWEAALGQRWG